MQDLTVIRGKINEMAALVLSMLQSTFTGFMRNDADILDCVLKDKPRLNAMEKEITMSLVEISKVKDTSIDKKNIMLLLQIVADLEQVSDYIKDMIERMEIKIEEKLLFSDDALVEYKHLYNIVETELGDVVEALKINDKSIAKRILGKTKEQADDLVGQYKDNHAKRLVSGICQPRTCNMFLDLLDFTGQVSRHTKAAAKNIADLA
jgi:phosphate:Na+ symporter